MHRIDGDGNVGNLFTEGDPGIGQQATKVTDTWLNAVQEEIVNVILAAGIALNKPVNTQLRDSIASLAAVRGYLAGLTLANNAGDATNDIDVAVGVARDTGNAFNIVLAAGLTKQLDAAWAVGTNQGMRASGAAIANTTYHIFLIRRTDTGVVDIAADTSVTGANIAANTNANYTQIRRIGSIIRVGGAISSFLQRGDEFIYNTPPALDVNTTNPGTAAVTPTLAGIPAGIKVKAFLSLHMANSTPLSTSAVRFSSPDGADVAPSQTATPLSEAGCNASGVGCNYQASVTCWTNTAQQIRYRWTTSDGNLTIRIQVQGWLDRRGRDD